MKITLITSPGPQQLRLDVHQLPAGQYSYRLVADGRPGDARHLMIAR